MKIEDTEALRRYRAISSKIKARCS